MRRRGVSVTELCDFAACETEYVLRQKFGQRRTAKDNQYANAGTHEHDRHDRNVRDYASTTRLFLSNLRIALIVGIPLSTAGILLNDPGFKATTVASVIISHALSGPGFLFLHFLQIDNGIATPLFGYALTQMLYYLTITTVVRSVLRLR